MDCVQTELDKMWSWFRFYDKYNFTFFKYL